MLPSYVKNLPSMFHVVSNMPLIPRLGSLLQSPLRTLLPVKKSNSLTLGRRFPYKSLTNPSIVLVHSTTTR